MALNGQRKIVKNIKPNYGLEFKAEEADGRNIEIGTLLLLSKFYGFSSRSAIGLITDNYYTLSYIIYYKSKLSFKTIESATMKMRQQLATVTFQT